MPDDKSKRGGPDRKRVAQHEPYEVDYFAKKHGMSAEGARAIIDRFGPSRERCDEAAERRKKSGGPSRHRI